MVSNISGVTGLKIIQAILAGARDPERLSVHRDGRCHASHQELVAALTGNYREERGTPVLFAAEIQRLNQFHLQQIAECDAEIEALLNTLAAQQRRRATRQDYQEARGGLDIRTPLRVLAGGTDLSQSIPSGRRPRCNWSLRSAPT